jgi:hypothetical protein
LVEAETGVAIPLSPTELDADAEASTAASTLLRDGTGREDEETEAEASLEPASCRPAASLSVAAEDDEADDAERLVGFFLG